MTLIFGFITVCIYLYFFLKDYKKGVILVAMSIQFLAYLGTGIPGVKISSFLMLLSVFIFILRKQLLSQKIKNETTRSYPKQLVFISLVFIFSFFISNYFASESQIGLVLINIMTSFAFPLVLWYAISSEKYLRYAVKCLIVLMLVAVIVAIPELLLGENLFTEFILNIYQNEDFVIDAPDKRFGLKRLNSIFSYFSVLGTISCFSFLIFFNLKYKYTSSYSKNKNLINLLCIALPFCAFATGSRAIFLGLFAIFLLCLCEKQFLRHKSFKKLLVIFTLASPLIFFVGEMVIDSIINSDTTKYAGGSNSELRMAQWEICLPYFLQSPIWGNGRLYIWNTVAVQNPGILGAESIWFSILVDYGIIGGISFLLLLILTGIILYRVKKSFVFLPISYFLITLVSPDSGIQYNIYLTFVILLLKFDSFAKRNQIDRSITTHLAKYRNS